MHNNNDIQNTREHSTREFLPGSLTTTLPSVLMGMYFAIKARHPFFFTNINPGIKALGIVEVSKWEILSLFPPENIPKTTVLHPFTELTQAESIQKGRIFAELEKHDLSLPLVVKPDSGGKHGNDVHIATNTNELRSALALARYNTMSKAIDAKARECIGFKHQMNILEKDTTSNILVQEYIDDPCEYSIYYYRLPDQDTGCISGITNKQQLYILGDGSHSIEELVAMHPRAHHFAHLFHKKHAQNRHKVLALGETYQLNSVGNHCKGSIFHDISESVTAELVAVIDKTSKCIPGFFCGRYDIKAKSFDHLEAGEFKILELNGIIAEPTRMYDPKHSRSFALRELWRHWKIIYQISQQQRARGVQPKSRREIRKLIHRHVLYWEV